MGPSVEGLLLFSSNSSAPLSKTAAMHMYGKNSFETESWYIALGTQGLPNLFKI